ncbi:MAG: TIGR04452 family lipoprotein [Leptospiraceae bacterium]|nr:TIGR04452 family lipoprotein [Leptospiraceae bacterium]
MKVTSKIFLMLLVVTSAHSCAYVDLDPNTVSGKEAKQIIADRLTLNLIIYGIGTTLPNSQLASQAIEGLMVTILTPDLIGLDEKVEYARSDVESCADAVFLFSFFVSTRWSPFVCAVSDPPITIPLVNTKL